MYKRLNNYLTFSVFFSSKESDNRIYWIYCLVFSSYNLTLWPRQHRWIAHAPDDSTTSMVATLSSDCRAFVEYPDSSKFSRITCNTFFVRRLSLLRELFRESLTHTNIHTGTKEAWLLVGCWSQREKGFADSFHASGVVDSGERSGGGLLLRCLSTTTTKTFELVHLWICCAVGGRGESTDKVCCTFCN